MGVSIIICWVAPLALSLCSFFLAVSIPKVARAEVKTKVINVCDVKIGGNNPISVQSMTNTLTKDAKSTIKQINDICEEGADLVRVSCPDEESTFALKEITKHAQVPIIADIHFHYKRAVEASENGAKCLRINPCNIGKKKKIY